LGGEKIIVAGVDEAGRGCVIGPLVICAFACDSDWEPELRRMGVKDSKQLTAQRRQELAVKLRKIGKHVLVKITAEQLSKEMSSKSLNEIEAEHAAQALNELQEKLSVKGNEFEKIFVDSPDPVPSLFEKRLRKYLVGKTGKARIVSENKADAKYACCSAASILAKVERDAEIEKIKKLVGSEFGSGYSSDLVTQEFLCKHFNDEAVKPFLREKWETVKRLRCKQMDLSKFV
jgi:ribonuclease HII